MKKLVCKYRSVPAKVLCIFHSITPFMALIAGVSAQNNNILQGLGSPVGNSSVGCVIALIFSLLFLAASIAYVFKTFSTMSNLRQYLISKEIPKHKDFTLAMVLHAVTLTIILLLSTAGMCAGVNNDAIKYVSFVMVALTVLTGFGSNLFFHLFESRQYFNVYYYRHKDKDVKEVLEGVMRSKQRKAAK